MSKDLGRMTHQETQDWIQLHRDQSRTDAEAVAKRVQDAAYKARLEACLVSVASSYIGGCLAHPDTGGLDIPVLLSACLDISKQILARVDAESV